MRRIAVAHLLHGFLGSGKSTLARRLVTRHEATLFSPDDWMVALFGRDPPAAEFARHAEAIKAMLEPQWTRMLALGVDVVLDYGFWSRAERDAARATTRAAGGVPRLYSLQADDDDARIRVARRNREDPCTLFIAPATYDALRGRFQPLDADEAHVSVP